jgi:hypothetical protein
MKLSDAAKHYEECFGPENPDFGCLYDNCPLHKNIRITAGVPYDEGGEIAWRIEGCSLMAKLERWLKGRKPGTKGGTDDKTGK